MEARPLHCPACAYDLSGLLAPDGAFCPECGRRFSWDELFRPGEPPTPRPWIIALFLTPGVVLAGLAFAMATQARRDPFAAATFGLLLGFGWSFYFAARRQVRSLPTYATPWQHLAAIGSGAGHATVIILVSLVPLAIAVVATI